MSHHNVQKEKQLRLKKRKTKNNQKNKKQKQNRGMFQKITPKNMVLACQKKLAAM